MSSLIEQKMLLATKETIGTGRTYPGYPSWEQRLHLSVEAFEATPLLDLPEGEWTASTNELPTPEQTESFQKAGYTTDSLGRPLHPWIKEMITDPNVGVVTGKGRYWNWGPNYTADPVVIAGKSNRSVLLIKRSDTGSWALPGGFVDDNERAVDAAKREASEEAGIADLGQPVAQIYKGVVADLRTTAHAWGETTAYLWQLDEPVPVEAGDDAVQVKWFSEHNLPSGLHGSHAELIKKALEYEPPTTLKGILELPPELLTVTPADGGHMAYDHLHIDGPHDRLFVKAHDASQFTDDFREKHSRDYLRKEQHYFSHLQAQKYASVPKRTELINDTILAMDAFRIEDRHLWRAPFGEHFHAYTSSILKALTKLGDITPPSTEYHADINPTYPTFWAEGWNDLSDPKLDQVREKIALFTRQFRPEFHGSAIDLSRNLKDLRDQALLSEAPTDFVLAHNDARQSNIAWNLNTQEDVILVDWSWADLAPRGADTTMFLIDLAKSGHDVSSYMETYFNKDHALTLIGFWLGHGLWNTRDGSTTVRMHQVASAVAAYKLIQSLQE